MENDIKACNKCEGNGMVKGRKCRKCSGEGFIFLDKPKNLDYSTENIDFFLDFDDLEDDN